MVKSLEATGFAFEQCNRTLTAPLIEALNVLRGKDKSLPYTLRGFATSRGPYITIEFYRLITSQQARTNCCNNRAAVEHDDVQYIQSCNGALESRTTRRLVIERIIATEE